MDAKTLQKVLVKCFAALCESSNNIAFISKKQVKCRIHITKLKMYAFYKKKNNFI